MTPRATKPVTKPVTAQQIFDRVASHLLKQGRRAVNTHGLCVLQAANGDRCAIGCLIPAKNYFPALEEFRVLNVWISRSALREHMKLLHALRAIHDLRAPGMWWNELHKVADIFQLSAAVIWSCEDNTISTRAFARSNNLISSIEGGVK